VVSRAVKLKLASTSDTRLFLMHIWMFFKKKISYLDIDGKADKITASLDEITAYLHIN